MLQGHKTSLLRVSLPFLIACFALLAAPRAHASAADEVDRAVAVSKAWVAEIDAAKYEDSYAFTCEETRNRYTQDHWVEVLKTIRAPWGGVIDRHQLSHVYKPNGIKGLNGECVVITYNTNFKNLNGVTESVVLKWQDGQWRGAGYFAGIPSDGSEDTQPSYTTDVQTDEHVKPQPDSP